MKGNNAKHNKTRFACNSFLFSHIYSAVNSNQQFLDFYNLCLILFLITSTNFYKHILNTWLYLVNLTFMFYFWHFSFFAEF